MLQVRLACQIVRLSSSKVAPLGDDIPGTPYQRELRFAAAGEHELHKQRKLMQKVGRENRLSSECSPQRSMRGDWRMESGGGGGFRGQDVWWWGN